MPKKTDGTEVTRDDDVVVLGDPLPDSEARGVLRIRKGQVEAGAVMPLAHGRPIVGEVVSLSPREGHERVCDVEVLTQAPAPKRTRSGPAQVATDQYRKNWDSIWNSPRPVGDDESKLN